MNNLIPSTEFVRGKDGVIRVRSVEVAERFKKEHRNVLRAIDNLIAQAGIPLLNFEQGSYTLQETGPQLHRCILMDRDGFSLLVMGFTGKEALEWKMAYIQAFNAMESANASADHMPFLNDPTWLRTALATYTDRVIALEEQVNGMLPLADFGKRVTAATGSVCFRDAAKELNIKPMKLMTWLRDKKWIYDGAGGKICAHQDKIDSGYLETIAFLVRKADGNEKMFPQTLVTPKGLARIAALYRDGDSSTGINGNVVPLNRA